MPHYIDLAQAGSGARFLSLISLSISSTQRLHELDVIKLLNKNCGKRTGSNVRDQVHYLALRPLTRFEPFRYRLRPGQSDGP